MSYEINLPSSKVYFCTYDPFRDISHHGEIDFVNYFSTGQMFLAHASSQSDAIDLIYSSWSIDDEDIIVGTPRTLEFSVGYVSEAEANTTVGFINALGLVSVKWIKHPTLDEWAIPYSAHVISAFKEGPLKDYLTTKHNQTVTAGNSRTITQMLIEGWMGVI
jgi:hypothetical protein